METTVAATTRPSTVDPTTNGGLSTDTITIIVGAIAGTLFLLVVIMLCIVACIYHRNSKKEEGDEEKRKSKKGTTEYRDRIFRPVDWGNPEGPGDGHDISDIDNILWEESHSRRGSIAMRNPAYKEDNEDGLTMDNTMSNGGFYPMSMISGNGPPRPPNLEMLPPERRQSSKSEDSSKPRSPRTPSSPTDSTQISILDKRTWGVPDLTADVNDVEDRPRSNSHMKTVSGPHNDPEIDFSVFGSGNMRGSALQDSTLRRSFRSRNQAIVDFYESGYSNSLGGRSAASLPMSRMDYQIESDERPSSEWGTGSRMLWQKRKFES